MDRLIEKHKFLIVGEGLKNALVALLFAVPFVSIESSSKGMNEKTKNYIKEKLKKGYKLLGAFDGDQDLTGQALKGRGAYEKVKEELNHEFNNLFSFTSGLDFADYLKDENSLIDFEKKFKQLFLNFI